MAYGLAIINAIAYRMEAVAPEVLGRVGMIARLIAWGASPVAAFFVGIVGDTVSFEYILIIGSLLPLIGVFLFHKAQKKGNYQYV